MPTDLDLARRDCKIRYVLGMPPGREVVELIRAEFPDCASWIDECMERHDREGVRLLWDEMWKVRGMSPHAPGPSPDRACPTAPRKPGSR